MVTKLQFSCFSSSGIHRLSPRLKVVCGVNGYSLENSCSRKFHSPALGRVCVIFGVTGVVVVCKGPSLGSRADRGFSLSTRCAGGHCGFSMAKCCGLMRGHVGAICDSSPGKRVCAGASGMNVTKISTGVSTGCPYKLKFHVSCACVRRFVHSKRGGFASAHPRATAMEMS